MSEKFFERSSAAAYRVIDGETIIMSATDSTLFSLNEVGSLIWQMADGRTTLSVMVSRICEEFDVERRDAWRDAEQFAAELVARGLLSISEETIPDSRPGKPEAA
jgi:GAF domain-containing protein